MMPSFDFKIANFLHIPWSSSLDWVDFEVQSGGIRRFLVYVLPWDYGLIHTSLDYGLLFGSCDPNSARVWEPSNCTYYSHTVNKPFKI